MKTEILFAILTVTVYAVMAWQIFAAVRQMAAIVTNLPH